MRCALTILLTLSIWASSSGTLHLLHDHHADEAIRHDESSCEICFAHHAPLMSAAASALTVKGLAERAILHVPDHSSDSRRTVLTITCRGPPAC